MPIQSSIEHQQIAELWVLQVLEQEMPRKQIWKTVSRPLTFTDAIDRLRKRQSSERQCRLLTGVPEALFFRAETVDFVS